MQAGEFDQYNAAAGAIVEEQYPTWQLAVTTTHWVSSKQKCVVFTTQNTDQTICFFVTLWALRMEVVAAYGCE